MNLQFQTRRAKIAGASVVMIALVAAIYWRSSRGVPSRLSENDTGEFLLVDAGDRALDGAPALALTFTLPLDRRKSYDKFIQVFEMPSPPSTQAEQRSRGDEESGKGGSIVSTKPEDTDTRGGAVVSAAWIVGDNPRLLFFPHTKPETRYVVQVRPGIE